MINKLRLWGLGLGIVGGLLCIQSVQAVETAPAISIRFGEFYKMPVGPEGLEPSEKLLALANKPVSLLGYVVDQNPPIEGHIILSPLPVLIDQQDESLADDLPPSAVFVHFDPHNPSLAESLTQSKGKLIVVQGVLTLGPQEEADGRVSQIQLRME